MAYVEERNLQSKTSVGAGRMANKERILLKKAPIKITSMPRIICLAIERNPAFKGGGPNLLGRDWLEEIRLDWEAIFQIVRDNPRSPLHELLSKY